MLYAAVYNDTDGYTYNAEVILGIFENRSDADGCILEMVEANKHQTGKYDWGNIEQYEVKEFELGQRWVGLNHEYFV